VTQRSLESARFGVRGTLLDYVGDPGIDPRHARLEVDGLLIVDAGKIVDRGAFEVVHARFPDVPVESFAGKIICPGFIDGHVHYPQLGVIASHGHQLLEWLRVYTFPQESAFADPAFAGVQARRFVQELLRHGTTTALALCTVHPCSVDALAEAALDVDLRMILGKVLMDCNAPLDLLDTPERAYDESAALIARWHRRGRLDYAITPRFAGTSSRQQLALAGTLRREHPSVYVHTHLAENRAEVAWMRELFPEREHYTDIYSHYGLLGERSVLAHGIHLNRAELRLLADTRSVIAFCPTSNLFLGSGLFPLSRVQRYGVRVALATDVGAGTSLCQLRTLAEAYKVLQLQQTGLTAHAGWYMATLGSARALSIDESVGSLEPGREADFIVLDWEQISVLAERVRTAQSIEEVLFAVMMLGDERCIVRTYVAGVCAYQRDP
jgi:guanine deaminase